MLRHVDDRVDAVLGGLAADEVVHASTTGQVDRAMEHAGAPARVALRLVPHREDERTIRAGHQLLDERTAQRRRRHDRHRETLPHEQFA